MATSSFQLKNLQRQPRFRNSQTTSASIKNLLPYADSGSHNTEAEIKILRKMQENLSAKYERKYLERRPTTAARSSECDGLRKKRRSNEYYGEDKRTEWLDVVATEVK